MTQKMTTMLHIQNERSKIAPDNDSKYDIQKGKVNLYLISLAL